MRSELQTHAEGAGSRATDRRIYTYCGLGGSKTQITSGSSVEAPGDGVRRRVLVIAGVVERDRAVGVGDRAGEIDRDRDGVVLRVSGRRRDAGGPAASDAGRGEPEHELDCLGAGESALGAEGAPRVEAEGERNGGSEGRPLSAARGPGFEEDVDRPAPV